MSFYFAFAMVRTGPFRITIIKVAHTLMPTITLSTFFTGLPGVSNATLALKVNKVLQVAFAVATAGCVIIVAIVFVTLP